MSQFCNTQRFGNRVFNAPPTFEPLVNSATRHVHAYAPVSQTQCLTPKSQKMIALLVATLFGIGSPFAVGRLVIPFVVDALNRMLDGRPFTQIAKKPEEPAFPLPAFADCNSRSAIFVVIDSVGVSNPLKHLIPTIVGNGSAVTVSPITPYWFYNFLIRHVHSFSVNVIDRVLGSLSRPFNPFILA